MENFLITLFYLARPVLTIEVDFKIFGLNFFEFVTIIFSLVLGALFFSATLKGHRRRFSTVEKWIIVFIIWCTVITVLFYDLSVFKSYIKWILPPFSFIVLKRAIKSREVYVKCLLWLIVGFFLPIFLSAIVTFKGLNLDEVVYKTGLPRYRGVYSGIHEMGHSTGICIMLIAIYVTLARLKEKPLSIKLDWRKYAFFVVLVLLALYCLSHTHVRTVYTGLSIFTATILFFYSKKSLIIVSGLAIVVSIIFTSTLMTIFFDVIDKKNTGANFEKAGSGRPMIWRNNFKIWEDAPIENKIAGLGVGNWVNNRIPSKDDNVGQIFNSHNDWLEVFIETGIVGFIIIIGLYIAIGLAILRYKGQEKYAYLAFFLAVLVMNFLSNSYIARFPMAQLFYMILVYIELPRPNTPKAVISGKGINPRDTFRTPIRTYNRNLGKP